MTLKQGGGHCPFRSVVSGLGTHQPLALSLGSLLGLIKGAPER